MATTLSLAEQNHAEELKRVCLEFVSRNLQAVMLSEGYQHMVNSCPQLQVIDSSHLPSTPLAQCNENQGSLWHQVALSVIQLQCKDTSMSTAVLLGLRLQSAA